MKKKFNLHVTPRFVLLILTIICVCSIGISYFRDGYGVSFRTAVGYIVVPLQTGINKVGGFFADLTDERISLQEALEENERLREENASLKEQIGKYSANMEELNRLQELLEIRDYYGSYEMTGATIIATESVNWNYRFTIDKGSDDGIRKDMTVISSEGLVGIVTEVAAGHAIVQTILDNSCKVSGMDEATLDTCIVSGNQSTISSGYIDLSYMDKDSSIENGTAIVTSNVSSKFVEGILIGTAADVAVDTNQLTKSGHLIPAVDFRHLKEVLVITSPKPDMTTDEK